MSKAPPQVILYGERTFQLEGDRVTSMQRGLDRVMSYWQGGSREDFRTGGIPPGYPHMRIKNCETVEEIPGHAYTHRWEAEGLLTAADKIESNRISQPEEGWDEGPMTLLTLRPEAFVQGQSHPLHPSLVLLETAKEDINGHVWRVELTCKGIYAPKAIKRRYSVNGKDVKSGLAFLITGEGGGDAQYWVMPRARLEMTERFLSTEVPPTELIGQKLVGGQIPTDTPLMYSYPVDYYAEKDWNWPYGWRVEGVTAERLMVGRPEHDITVTYSLVPQYDVKGTA